MEDHEAVSKSPLVRDIRNSVTELMEEYYKPNVPIQQKRMLLGQAAQALSAINDPEKEETGRDYPEPNFDPFYAKNGLDACVEHFASHHGDEFRTNHPNCACLYKTAKRLVKIFKERGWMNNFDGLHPC